VTPEEKLAVQFLRVHLEAAREAIKVVDSAKFVALDKELKAVIDRMSEGGDVC
jgi:hypothetical protein